RSATEMKPELLSGYKLATLIGRGTHGEVWKGVSADGSERAIKIVYGRDTRSEAGMTARSKGKGPPSNGEPADEDAALPAEHPVLERVRAIDHPHLIHIDQIENKDGQWVVVMELAQMSLADAFKEHRGRHQAGIPRDDLLEYLAEAAEALDIL